MPWRNCIRCMMVFRRPLWELQFSSVQSLSCVQLFATPWVAARQTSLSITNSRSSLRLMSIKSVMPSSHLVLCHPLLFLPPIPPNIRVFSNESALRMRWPKYWSFSFSIILPCESLGDNKTFIGNQRIKVSSINSRKCGNVVAYANVKRTNVSNLPGDLAKKISR